MRLKDTDKDFIVKLGRRHIGATFGGDPEFFITDENKEVMASDKFFPSKEKPLVFKGMYCYEGKDCDKLKLFFDGIQAEMNIGVQRCREYMADNVRKCIMRAINIIEKKNKKYKILLKPSVEVSKKVIEEADPEARRFGCMPDFNAYTLTTNTSEIDATDHPYRYAGGHIHLGISSPYIKKSSGEYKMAKTEGGHIRIIKLLDLIVGIPCVILDDSKEAIIRRSEYGKAGCFRPTPYGIEYRTPSCWWIKAPVTVSLILGLARLAWTIAGSDVENNLDKRLFELIKCSPEDIKGICDESDKKEAIKVWNVLKIYLALLGTPSSNPISIKSFKSGGAFIRKFDCYSGEFPTFSDLSGKVIHKRRVPIFKPVFSFAAFEYIVKNGLSSIISDNVKKEWSIGKNFNNCDGFLNGMYTKLSMNKDFMIFQNSLLEEII